MFAKEEKVADSNLYFYACGKRKTSSARVRLYPNGKGKITINGEKIEKYFPMESQRNIINSPFMFIEHDQGFDVMIKVIGGGIMSQAGAIKHGIAKALVKQNDDYRSVLKKAKMLVRDDRIKERKKPGLKRARKSPQWSKR